MPTTAGHVVLLGSGETAAPIRKVYHWLFKQLDSPIQLSILETPAGFEPNSPQVVQHIADFFQKRLQNFQPDISIIPARKRDTPFSPDNPELLTSLYKANVLMMGPGSPTYAVRQLRDSLAWHTLLARHRLGAALILASAATVAASALALPVYEIYKVGEELHWKPGLKLFEPFGLSLVFIPHWNNNDGGADLDTNRCYMGQTRFNQLVKLLPPDSTIVGIDEHTALVFDFKGENCRVMGAGSVTLVRGDQETVFSSEQTFSIGELGPFHLPEPETGIPAGIWAQVQQAQVETAVNQDKPRPSPEVIALVEQRAVARSRKEWSVSDAMRAEIEKLGWKVLDTPEGTKLERA